MFTRLLQNRRDWPGQGHNYYYIHNPGYLGKNDKDLLVSNLAPLAKQGFGREPTDTPGHILGVEHLVVFTDFLQNPVGFAGFDEHNWGFHLEGIVLHPGAQHRGVGGAALDIAIRDLFPRARYITLFTQNPVMYLTVRSRCNVLYPIADSSLIPAGIQHIAYNVVGRDKSFCAETSVYHGRYAYCLYPSIPISADQAVNELFIDGLRVENGQSLDGYFCVGELKRE